MIGKKLIFDVVLIGDDVDVFEIRFKKLYEIVDYFLIFGDQESLEKLKEFYGVIDHKIKTFTLHKNYIDSLENNKFISISIQSTLEKLYKTFEDYVFISYDNEIPDIESLTEEQLNSKEVTVLLNDVYEYDSERKRKYPEVGPVLVNFSHILKNKKNFFYGVMQIKKSKRNQDTHIRNGFKILNYKKTNDIQSKFYECPVSKNLVEYHYKREKRKFVFFIDTPMKDCASDYRFEIKSTNKFPEETKIDLNKSENFLKIFVPEYNLYGSDTQSFNNVYKINEIKRIISIFDCKDEDDIEIFIDEQVKKLKYHEIKNPSL
jgi:hypothetical protein